MNRMFCVVLIALAMFGVMANSAFANIIADVQALTGAGYTVSGDGKTVTVTNPAAVITMELYAIVSGTDRNPGDTNLQMLSGGIKTGMVPAIATGKLVLENPGVTNGYMAPFNFGATTAVTTTSTLLGLNGATTTSRALGF